jgi:hypothetical protein
LGKSDRTEAPSAEAVLEKTGWLIGESPHWLAAIENH